MSFNYTGSTSHEPDSLRGEHDTVLPSWSLHSNRRFELVNRQLRYRVVKDSTGEVKDASGAHRKRT